MARIECTKGISHMRTIQGFLGILAAIAMTCWRPALAQQNAQLLHIASPADGSLISPGQTISVSVTSPAGIPVTQVFVVGENPIGFSSIASSIPSQFTL